MLGFIIYALAQPLNLTFLVLNTFPHKRSSSAVRTYLLYSCFFISFIFIRLYLFERGEDFWYLVIVNTELLVVLGVAYAELRGYLWTNFIQLVIMGALITTIGRFILMQSALTKDYYQSLVMLPEGYNIPLNAAIYGVAITFLNAFILTNIFSFFVLKYSYQIEKICKVLSIILAIAYNMSAIIAHPLDNVDSWNMFEIVVIPTLYIIVTAILFVLYNIFKNREWEKNIVLLKEEIDSASNEDTAQEDNIKLRRFISLIRNKYERKGVVIETNIDVRSDSADYVSNKDIRILFYDILRQIDSEIKPRGAYLVINIKCNSENMLVHFEYSKKRVSRIADRIKKNNLLFVSDLYYKYEKKGVSSNEIIVYICKIPPATQQKISHYQVG